MKPFLFSLLVIAFATAIFSCKKDSSSSTPSVPLLQKTTSLSQGGVPASVTYTYDGNRLIKAVNQDNSYFTVEYSTNTVIEKDYNTNNQLTGSMVYSLNQQGYAVSAIGSSSKSCYALLKDRMPITNTLKLSGSKSITFSYDADGYMTLMSTIDATGIVTLSFIVSNGNQVTTTIAYSGVNIIQNNQYLSDKVNTTGSQNMGMNFLGKQNRNLVGSVISTSNGNSILETFTYQYDSQGRPIVQTIMENGQLYRTNSYQYK